MPSLLADVAIVIAAGFVLLSGYILAEAMYYQCLHGPGLERDLGFKEGSALLPNSSLTGSRRRNAPPCTSPSPAPLRPTGAWTRPGT